MRHHFLLLLLIVVSSVSFAQEFGLVPYRKGNLWGYSDTLGKIVVEPKYERTYFYTPDGLARIRSGGLYGYIDASGKMVIIPKYTEASDFYMGVAEVSLKKRKHCINVEGEPDECIPPDETEEEQQEEEPFLVEKTRKGYRLISLYREDTLHHTLDDVKIVPYYFFPDLNYFAIVKKNGLTGAYSPTGIAIAPIEFLAIDILDMESYKARKNNLWGVRNFENKEVFPFEYDSVRKVSNLITNGEKFLKIEHYILGKNNKYGVVNQAKKVLLPFTFDEVRTPPECNCLPEYVFRQNGLVGLADHEGKVVIQPRYADLKQFSGARLTLVKNKAGAEGYINRKGFEYFTD